ncbi:MAG: peroxiredoxin family protein [Elusimicrobiota bacterium]
MKKILAVILAATFAACGAPDLKPVRTDVPAPPVPAQDFALTDLSGATVRLSDFRGKTVLLDFWATWCVPCKQSIPRYIKMQDKLRSRGFVVVGVDEGETAEAVTAFERANRRNYQVLLDPDAALFKKYGARSLPAAFLIDPQGNIRGQWEGFDAATGLDVERATDLLLGTKPRI